MIRSKLELGKRYSRAKISKLLGGGEHVNFLPSKEGKIIAGCFKPKKNHRAPIEVDVGDRVEVLKRARKLGKTKGIIPVFLMIRSGQWEYVGNYRCVSFSEKKADIEAYPDRRKGAVGVLYFEEVTNTPKSLPPAIELFEIQAKEGRKRLVSHLKRERNPGLITAKRNEVRVNKGCLICEACGQSEKKLPKDIAEACFEVHHKTPLSKLKAQTVTKLVDLSLLCANCHRMTHRGKPMLTLQALRNLLV